ncbi:hypothetical protein K2173_014781 [Erythroxylum novogranatense]|uniref:Uncharacterized protein n=1 Tax=Erythroxylum novogranatense TaxID=1862640 RepID=A0AAV8TI42_9ROSI|nr:hypothetical protein K2173_014781 [Erythroxylum novogranatense]
MSATRHFSRIDILELKSRMEKKLGRLKAEKYFDLLTKFFSLKINKCEFDRLCIGTIGRENVHLHNLLLKSIIKNASNSKIPPTRESKLQGASKVKVPNGYHRSNLQSFFRDFPHSPRKVRTSSVCDRKFKDRPSPLGPHGKSHNIAFKDSVLRNQEQQSATELLSLGSRHPGSSEDGEEVDQASGSPGIHSRSPVRAPLGISLNAKGARKVLCNHLSSCSHMETCHISGQLPDTVTLRKRLEQKLEKQGLSVSEDFVNLLNHSLDVYLKRLMKPCLDLASSSSEPKQIGQQHSFGAPCMNGMLPSRYVKRSSGSCAASMLDFRVAMELNPSILGEEWPTQLEKICLHVSEE